MASLPRFTLPLVGRLDRYVRSLPAGDRFIALLLGFVVVVTSLLGIFALERSFLVRVPAYGGSLTEGIVGTPRFANPILAISDTDRDLVALTYAGLMGRSSDGTLVPVLAESYSIAPSGTVYTFTLRAGATFSDGTPVTADDVVYTIQKAQDPALKSPVLANWANIRATAVDARTVRFTLPKPYAPFLEDATLGILPAHLWRPVADSDFPFSPLMTFPVGAGPFQVADVSHGKNGAITSYDLNAFKGYITGRPYLDSLHLVFYSDQSALTTAVREGNVESAYGIATNRALRASYSRIFGVFFNSAQEPLFAKLEVRKALSVAIDRDGLVKDVLGGYGSAAIGPVPAGENIAPLPLPNAATRVADAQNILKAAKWTFDPTQKVWKNGSQTLSVTLKTSNVPELKTIASRVQQDWQAIGVPVSVELYDANELTQTVIRPRNYGALFFGEVIGRSPDLYAFWDSAERTNPGLNVANYSNKQVDMILERMRTETDPAVVKADLAQANQLIAADYPAAFMYTPDFVYTVPSDLSGVSLGTVASPSDRFATVAHWYRNTELVWPFLLSHS